MTYVSTLKELEEAIKREDSEIVITGELAKRVVIVRTAKELGKAIKQNQSQIVIEGDLGNMVGRIKVTGKLAWAVCAAGLGAAIWLAIATPAATVASAPVGGAGGAISFGGGVGAAATAATVLGIPATIAAVTIGIAAGGIGGIISLRDRYRITLKNGSRLLLERS